LNFLPADGSWFFKSKSRQSEILCFPACRASLGLDGSETRPHTT
jgi:hypothetical protein